MNKDKKKLNKKQKMYVIISAIALIIAANVALILSLNLFGVTDKKDKPDEVINEDFSFLLNEEVEELKNYDLASDQYKMMSGHIAKFKKGNYTIDNPLVITNPVENSPLTAIVMFRTGKKQKVTVTVKGKHDNDLVTTFEASQDHYLPIYGLYGDYNNQVIIETEKGEKNTLSIKTEFRYDLDLDVTLNNVTNKNGEFYFATSSFGAPLYAFDNYGDIRWYISSGFNKGITMLSNGHMLVANAAEGPDITSTSGVVEIDMLGYVHKQYIVAGGYHHDGYEMPNGNLILLTSDVTSNTIADYIVEVDKKTGKVVKDWKLKEIALAIDPTLIRENELSWGWINGITYDQKAKAFILSVRNQNSVVSIDYETGKINWILGEKKYWSDAFNEYFITGVGNDFIYPLGEHSVNITEEGYLSIFNNGYNAYREDTVPCKDLKNSASYAIVYKLDLDNKTAEIVYKFGGHEYFSYALSSYNKTSDGHMLFNSGWHFPSEEVYDNPECTQFNNDQYDAVIVEFDENKNQVFNVKVGESIFELIKAPIYNLEAVSVNPKTIKTVPNYVLELNQFYTDGDADEYVELTEEEAKKYSQNETNFVSFLLINYRLKLLGTVPEDMKFKVTLINSKGKAYQYTFKNENESIKDYVNISNLPSGKYYLYVEIGDKVFNSTEYITIP